MRTLRQYKNLLNLRINLLPQIILILFITLLLSKLPQSQQNYLFVIIGSFIFTFTVFWVAYYIESKKISIHTAFNILLILSIFLFKPNLPVKIYTSAGMYIRITITLCTALLTGWVLLLSNILNGIKIYSNRYSIPVYIILTGALIAYPRVLDYRAYFIWFLLTLYLMTIINIQYYILHKTSYEEHKIYILGTLVLLIIVITLANIFLQNYKPTSVMFFYRSKGIFTNPNSLGIFSTVSIYILIAYGIINHNKPIRIILIVFVLLLLYLVNKSVSRNAVLSLSSATALFIFLSFNKNSSKIKLLFSSILSLISMLFIIIMFLKFAPEFSIRFETAIKGKEASTLLRILMAKNTLSYIIMNPANIFWGSGPYQFYHYKFSFGLAGPHNIFIDWWFSFGIFGIISLLLFLYVSFIKPFHIVLKFRNNFSKKEFLYRVALLSAMVAFWASTLLDEVFWAIHHTILYNLLPFILTIIPHLIIEQPSRKPISSS